MARVNTKQLIVDAAVAVAAQHGISGASMDQIAETAGVAKGSLYYNFASKDALFAEVMRRGSPDPAKCSARPLTSTASSFIPTGVQSGITLSDSPSVLPHQEGLVRVTGMLSFANGAPFASFTVSVTV